MSEVEKPVGDELVGLVVDYVPDLAGYRINEEWIDHLGPDRVLVHHSLPPVGIEMTELLSDTGRKGSACQQKVVFWDKVVALVQQHPSWPRIRDVSVAFHGSGKSERCHPKEAAAEVVGLLLVNLPPPDGSLVRVGRESLLQFPFLSRELDAVTLWRDGSSVHWKTPDWDWILSHDWFELALETAVEAKARKVDIYRSNMSVMAKGQGVSLRLLTWSRNEWPPSMAVIDPSPAAGRRATKLRNSGFDSIYYISGIRDANTGKLNAPWELYPRVRELVL